ncbi:MAG: hypothetical protein M1833_001839 [Piccolia ochrophora]|nr:MAG: hypothetical protein M1833_001839 [Piccolia ochrophora]
MDLMVTSGDGLDPIAVQNLQRVALGIHQTDHDIRIQQAALSHGLSRPPSPCTTPSVRKPVSSDDAHHRVSSHANNHTSFTAAQIDGLALQPPLYTDLSAGHQLRMNMAVHSTPPSIGDGLNHSDTQPLPDWVVNQYLERLGQAQSPRRNQQASQKDEGTGHEVIELAEQKEETGDIDLLKGCESLGAGDSGPVQAQQGHSSPSSSFSSSPGPGSPMLETQGALNISSPEWNRKKLDHESAILSEPVTPRPPHNPFAGAHAHPEGLMDLSQVFKATQAYTPIANPALSDPLDARPSPDFYNARQSPRLLPLSSPLQSNKPDLDRAATEPRTAYVPMVESQEERDRFLRQHRSSSANPKLGDDFSDDELNLQQSERIRERMRREKILKSVRGPLAKVCAPRGHGTAQVRWPMDADRQRALVGSNEASPYCSSSPNMSLASTHRRRLHEQTTPRDVSNIDTMVLDSPHGTKRRASDTEHEIGSIQVPETILRRSLRRHSIDFTQNSPLDLSSKRAKIRGDSLEEDEITSSLTRSIAATVAVVDSQRSPQGRDAPNPSKHHSSPTDTIHSWIGSQLFVTQSQPKPLSKNPLQNVLNDLDVSGLDYQTSPMRPHSFGVASQADDVSGSRSDSLLPGHAHESVQVVLETSTPNTDADADGLGKPSKAVLAGRSENAVGKGENSQEPVHFAQVPLNKKSTQHRLAEMLYPPRQFRESADDAAACRRQPSVTANSINLDTSPAGMHMVYSDSAKDTDSRNHSSSPPGSVMPVSTQSVARSDIDTLASEEEQSYTTTHYETARSTREPSLPPLSLSSQQPLTPDRRLRTSPNKRIRTLTEIGSDPSPPNAIQDVDMDIGLVNSQDYREFSAAIDTSSPVRPAKRRKRATHTSVVPPTKQTITQPLKALANPNAIVCSKNSRSEESAKPLQNQRSISSRPEAETPQASDLQAVSSANDQERSSGITGSEELPEEAKIRSEDDAPTGNDHLTPQVAFESLSAALSQRESSPRSISGNDKRSNSNANKGDEQIFNANRVLALFKGGNLAYYPATCLVATAADRTRLKVRFDDGTIDVLDSHFVRRFELRKGDTVKVDLSKMRTKNYTVVGLKENRFEKANEVEPGYRSSLTSARGEYRLCDIYGHETVVLQPKQRERLSTDSASRPETIEVPLWSIYIVQSNWVHFQDRKYTHISDFRSGQITPRLAPSLPTTPSSRSRRVTSGAFGQISFSRALSFSLQHQTGLFAGMSFAVSYVGRDEEKRRIIKSVIYHGGHILADGFEELFHVNTTSAVTTDSPEQSDPEQQQLLQSTPTAALSGFTCLLADHHSRRAKYMQALALGLPCLAGRWIEDCVLSNTLLSWEPYLLPSGESTFLGGAIRSRVLNPYPADTARFEDIIATRPKLLEHVSVLLVVGKGKEEERRRAYDFLTCAMGAKRVERVVSLELARQAVETGLREGGEKAWDWVYVGGKVEEAEKVIFGAAGAGKKRKRGAGGAAKGRVRVVDDEFVVQSLILGKVLGD